MVSTIATPILFGEVAFTLSLLIVGTPGLETIPENEVAGAVAQVDLVHADSEGAAHGVAPGVDADPADPGR